MEVGSLVTPPPLLSAFLFVRLDQWVNVSGFYSLLPLLAFCYMLQFLDKSSLNYSALLGLRKDTVSILENMW